MRTLLALAACLAGVTLPAASALADAATGGTAPSRAGSPTATTESVGTGAANPVSGQAAQQAWQQLGTAAARQLGRRVLHRGTRGADVRVLQRVLSELLYRIRVSGTFDTTTQRTVVRFQRQRNLAADGQVGPQTVRALRVAHAALYTPPPQTTAPAGAWVFPIRGPHDYGTAINRYGAPRGDHTHQGQDVLADCGLPLVAAHGGQVVGSGAGGAAGYYLAVHTLDTPYDYFYAHLLHHALVAEGQSVSAGQLVGYVGETGDATACHLHFELWQGQWWNGGHTIDPLPFLRTWDRAG
jgi:murein DD-endopeptidase MepM/ murein hydrolase activator NlpD